MKWTDIDTETMTFKNQVLDGCVKKQVEKMKVFNIGLFPRRYISINFRYARLTIQKDKKDPKTAKVVLFRDIKECYSLEWQGNKDKHWCHSFFLKTYERDYVLVAPSQKEKQIWLSAFRYIILSTVALQDIIKDNEERYREGLASVS